MSWHLKEGMAEERALSPVMIFIPIVTPCPLLLWGVLLCQGGESAVFISFILLDS